MPDIHTPNPGSEDPPGDFYRMISAISVVIASSQLMMRKLKNEQAMTHEQIVAMLSTIQRSGWEAARLAKLLDPGNK